MPGHATMLSPRCLTISIAFCLPLLWGCGAAKVEKVAFAQPLVEEASTECEQLVPSDQETEAGAEDQSSYKAPYPDRVTLFAPPRFEAPLTRRSEASESGVVLLGFANIDRPLALLAIGRDVHSLGGGEEVEGVRVIQVDPPRAVLQRGSTRWTETIH